MPDFECPECGGGFPAAAHDNACPWCGEAMDNASNNGRASDPMRTVPDSTAAGGMRFARDGDLGTSTTPEIDPDCQPSRRELVSDIRGQLERLDGGDAR